MASKGRRSALAWILGRKKAPGPLYCVKACTWLVHSKSRFMLHLVLLFATHVLFRSHQYCFGLSFWPLPASLLSTVRDLLTSRLNLVPPVLPRWTGRHISPPSSTLKGKPQHHLLPRDRQSSRNKWRSPTLAVASAASSSLSALSSPTPSC